MEVASKWLVPRCFQWNELVEAQSSKLKRMNTLYDVHRIFAALREEEKKHGDRLVRVVPRHASGESTALREEPPKNE